MDRFGRWVAWEEWSVVPRPLTLVDAHTVREVTRRFLCGGAVSDDAEDCNTPRYLVPRSARKRLCTAVFPHRWVSNFQAAAEWEGP